MKRSLMGVLAILAFTILGTPKTVATALGVADTDRSQSSQHSDDLPTLEEAFAKYRPPSQIQQIMRAAVCDTSCQRTLKHQTILGQCVMLSWEMNKLHNCRVTCIESIADDCAVLYGGLQPQGITANSPECSNPQFRTFYSKYQSDNLGGGLLQDLYEDIKNSAVKRALGSSTIATCFFIILSLNNLYFDSSA